MNSKNVYRLRERKLKVENLTYIGPNWNYIITLNILVNKILNINSHFNFFFVDTIRQNNSID